MIVYPNCKINLGLNVISKRPDGYHNIESIFYPVPWCDLLEIIPSDKNSFVFDGISVNCPQSENLCYKAFQLLKNQYDIPDISLYLYKKIPFGAGLGGGSSDGAFTLSALNELLSLNLDKKTLAQMASCLGSDCAFFAYNQPGYITGTGTDISPLSLTLKGYYIVIIKPDIAVSTKEAYQMIRPKKPDTPLLEIVKRPVSGWKELLINDFEEPVFLKYPKIRMIKNKLYENGAVYASMSGSGSAFYGLFTEDTDIEDSFQNCIVWKGCLS